MVRSLGCLMLVSLVAVACGGSAAEGEQSAQDVTAAPFPASAVGGYYVSTPQFGAALNIRKLQPFTFELWIMSKTEPADSGKAYASIDSALAGIRPDGWAMYAPADDCNIEIRWRNDGVELHQTGTCQSEGFPQGFAPNATGLYTAQPKNVGDCQASTITSITGRFGEPNDFSSGMSITYDDVIYNVSYESEAPVTRSRVGDPVRVCLASIPTNCPEGDYRGKMYKVTNLRTNESWELPDSEHGCGGA